jgi:hypothetical protein
MGSVALHSPIKEDRTSPLNLLSVDEKKADTSPGERASKDWLDSAQLWISAN